VLEYPIALVAACLLRPTIGPRGGTRARVLDVLLPALFGLAIVVSVRWPLSSRLGPNGVTYVGAAFALVCLAFLRRPVRFGLGVAAIMLAFAIARGRDTTDLLAARSFFGVYHVRGYTNYHAFQHGTTTHGGQSTLARWRREPLTYYHREGPLGQMFASLMTGKAERRVAIVGLGTGTIACYARPGERWTYYEIDPLIVRIATDPRYFTYVRDCAPATRIVLGDARLSLAHAPDGAYDFIILDAFSSDAIPAHLITREALALYLRKLAPGGVVTFHISNRYLKLEPVLSELARDARLAGAFGADTGLTRAQREMYKSTSEWVALSRRASDLALLVRQPGWRPLRPQASVRLWTDDFSDILSVFSW
jgi:SAM-dependent methyltransferase